MVVGDHVGDDRLLIRVLHADILRVQKAGESQTFLCHVEGIVQVVVGVTALQLVKLDQVRSATRQFDVS